MNANSIDMKFDSTKDNHAKTNRNNKAHELKEQGYLVACSRETTIRGADVYVLFATKEQTAAEEKPTTGDDASGKDNNP